jgi:hypothetical protein
MANEHSGEIVIAFSIGRIIVKQVQRELIDHEITDKKKEGWYLVRQTADDEVMLRAAIVKRLRNDKNLISIIYQYCI